MNREQYTKYNAEQWDQWVEDGIEWGIPISHEDYLAAKKRDMGRISHADAPGAAQLVSSAQGGAAFGVGQRRRTADAGFCRFGRKLYGV